MDIVLVSKNLTYMDRFERYIRLSHMGNNMRIHRFASVEAYRDYRASCFGEGTVLIDEALYEQSLMGDLTTGGWNVVKLVQRREDALTDRMTAMYQPVSRIIEHAKQHAADKDRTVRQETGPLEERTARTPHEDSAVIAVASPYGGCGVTTIAYHLARLMAMRREKVLYVHMDLYPEPLIVPDVQHDFSRLLYMLTTRPLELERNWQQYCGIHPPSGVYCFRQPPLRRDLRDVRSEHLNELSSLFRRIGFQTIVLDIDAHWLDDIIEEKLHYDECWLVAPWHKRDLHAFPSLRQLVGKPGVKYIVKHMYNSDLMALDAAAELDVDAALPFVPGKSDREHPIIIDDKLEKVIARLLRESSVTGRGGEHG